MEYAQSIRDKIQWELAINGSKLTRSVLRRSVGIKYSDIDPILEELERDGKDKEDRARFGQKQTSKSDNNIN